MMLGEESTSADYWKKCGDEALANGIKGVVMMVCPFRQPYISPLGQIINKNHRELTGTAPESTRSKLQ